MSTTAVIAPHTTDRRPFLFGLSALIILLDRLSKLWISHHIDLGNERPVIPGVFWLSHVLNDGAAFSLFSYSSKPGLVRVVLIAFSVIAAVAVLVVLLKIGRRFTGTTVALALILGGAIGNLYDRLVYGTVIDFLEVHLKFAHWTYHWPDFNVADSAIVCGGILLFLDAFRTSPQTDPSS